MAENTSFRDELLHDVLRGLSQAHKHLPCKYFYDEEGSRLFDRICELPEYYPTRTEAAILRRHGREIAELLGPRCALIEYGSGSSLKTRLLLDQVPRAAAYVPVDISGEHLARSARALEARYPGLRVLPVCADFTRPLALPPLPPHDRRAVYFSGSTIGNFGPPEAVGLLAGIARLAGPGGGLLIGVDLKKDVRVLEAAYNDAAGVTAAFNLNLLARINRELGADFDLGRFRHRARYNAREGRIEMYLFSLVRQVVRVGPVAFSFEAGEAVCTEHSYKYDLEGFAQLAGAAGLEVAGVWMDEGRLFSVQYLTVRAL
jgi:dimethylhistidine N-methyltransferase